MVDWISVSEKLPDAEYDWLLISAVDCFNPKLRFVPEVAELRKGKWATSEHNDYESQCHVKVTHWMPLPSPPRD